MASVALVSFAGSWYGFDYVEDILTSMGHTMTVVIDTTVTATNLSAYDLIILMFTTADQATLASHLDNHMDTFGIPVLVSSDFHGVLTDDNYITDSGKVANRLGMYATTYRNRYEGGVDEAGYGFNVPQDNFENHEVSLYKPAYGTQPSIVATGFQNHIDDWEGESFIWGNPPAGGTGDIVVAQPGLGPVAGSPLCRLRSSYWGDYREICGTIIEAGDSRVGQRTGTFSTNMAWMGFSGGVLTGNSAQLFELIVRWCLGEYASLAYSAASYTASLRYPSIDFSDIAGTTLGSATMDWDVIWPSGSASLYYISWDGGISGWTQFAAPGAIPGASIGAPLAGMRLTIRTSFIAFGHTPPDSPSLENLKVTWTSEQATLTASPADYFQEGHLLWTSGANSGQSMEVKSYVEATKTMKLFLKMREPIAAGDTFTVLPGCDKKKATCIAKFANILNFQGEPDIPGEDQTLKTAEVK